MSIKLKDLTINQITLMLILSVVFMHIISLGLSYVESSYDDSDDYPNHKRSGMTVRTDYKTGIQYLESRTGYLIRRGDRL